MTEKHPHGRGEDLLQAASPPLSLETPPRAWGRPLLDRDEPDNTRNTPTGVGKTIMVKCGCFWGEKHPHGRGEDVAAEILHGKHVETPPRAWGRLVEVEHKAVFHEKHPHGRGED